MCRNITTSNTHPLTAMTARLSQSTRRTGLNLPETDTRSFTGNITRGRISSGRHFWKADTWRNDKSLNAIGGLARGLASGINMGMQWRNQQELIDVRKKEGERLAKADERDAEIHELRKDQYASEKEIRDRR